MGEIQPTPAEHEVLKNQWLLALGNFIVEAGSHGWAAEVPKVESPQRPGFKESAYQRDDWEYRDSYAGYYMGPGSSVIYYKSRPVWYMSYGGEGLKKEYYTEAKETYAFLRKAFMEPDPLFSVRGPQNYWGGPNKHYRFDYEGDLSNGTWSELIELVEQDERLTIFSQRGEVGLIIDKDENRKPIYPWDL